ncbi:hypothetical protein F511_46367 [Dorcoceras hygrometricum]|uniref:Uncharacterized protein n=1 Tax=Dorcoceras hygrometricum TaxID=472368 RepID=A0A2Z7A151_9LAMI|nr:hypothetical protein F511_46367 [Dorcoceras hygrometricum]
MPSQHRRKLGGAAAGRRHRHHHENSRRQRAQRRTSATQPSATMRPAIDQSTQQLRQASPTVGKHVRPVRRMSSRAAQSSGKRSASVRNGLRKQPAIRPPLVQRRSTRCTTRRAAALIQARSGAYPGARRIAYDARRARNLQPSLVRRARGQRAQ